MSPLRLVDGSVDGAGFERVYPGLNGPLAFVGKVSSMSGAVALVNPVRALDGDGGRLGPLVVDTVQVIVAEVDGPGLDPRIPVLVRLLDGRRWVAQPIPA